MRTESNFFHDFQGGGGSDRIFPLNSLLGGFNLSFEIGLYLKYRVPLRDIWPSREINEINPYMYVGIGDLYKRGVGIN